VWDDALTVVLHQRGWTELTHTFTL
jgi:hypothetical protein